MANPQQHTQIVLDCWDPQLFMELKDQLLGFFNRKELSTFNWKELTLLLLFS